ncbi:MAG: BON domain-containing protein [Gemmatimonadaceae bacterium]
MADDFDNSDEIQNLDDDELKSYIHEELTKQKAIDVRDVTIEVKDGAVTISGRVGTESELRIADHVMTDVISVPNFDNQLVVDELRRAESPEAIDDHLVDEEEHSGLLLGDEPRPYSAESEHLADIDDGSIGTHDVHEAIESAEPWIPPESPTPEGAAGQ